MKHPTGGFGAVDHDRARTTARHTSTALHHGVEGVLQALWNVLTRCCRDSRHAATPSRGLLLGRHCSNSLPQRLHGVICVRQFWFDSHLSWTTMEQESMDNSPTEVLE